MANRKSAKLFDLLKVAPFGMGGPNKDTSFDLVTAILFKNNKNNNKFHALICYSPQSYYTIQTFK